MTRTFLSRPMSTAWATALLLALSTGCSESSSGGDGDEDTSVDIVEADTTDDTSDDVTDDDTVEESGACPGVAEDVGGVCTPTEVGSAGCIPGSGGCVDLNVTPGCTDSDGDGWHDGLGETPLYVDRDVAIGDGDGSIQNPFASISLALESAEDGAIIVVMATEYDETVRIEGKSNVQLLGPGTCDDDDKAQIDAGTEGDPAIIIADSPGTVVQGFVVRGGGGGIRITGESTAVQILDMDITQTSGNGIGVADDTDFSGLEIRNTVIRNTLAGDCGIQLTDGSDVTIQTVEIRSASGAGICASIMSDVTLDTVTLDDNSSAGLIVDRSQVEATNITAKNHPLGGILVVGNTASAMLSRVRLFANQRAHVLIEGDVEVDAQYVWIVGDDDEPDDGFGVAFTRATGNATVQNAQIEDLSAPGVVFFGDGDSVPASAAPTEDDGDIPLVAETLIRRVAGAGVLLLGAAGARVVDSQIFEVANLGETDPPIGDGFAGLYSAVVAARVTVADAARHAFTFTDSKARIEEATISGSGADDVVCAAPQCPNLNYDGGSTEPNAEPVQDLFSPLEAGPVLP